MSVTYSNARMGIWNRRWLGEASVVLCFAMSACSSTPKSAPPTVVKQTGSLPTTTAQISIAVSGASDQPVTSALVSPEAQQKFDAAMKLATAGKQDEAALQLEQLANAYPSFAAPLINLGLLYLKANQFDAAVNAFSRALERDPKSAMAHNYLGVCYRNLGKFKEAEAAYQAAIASDESYAAAHLNLGVLYDLYLQQPELALAEYERYQQLLALPDTKVAGWIKELKTRSKTKTGNADVAGDKS